MNMSAAFRVRLEQAMASDARSRAEIARVSGYSRPHLRRLIKGERRSPTLELVDAMADTLGVSRAWLLGLSESMN